MSKPILSTQNAHLRDQNIRFFEEGHKYIVYTDPDSKYTSVTTFNHSHFPHFDADDVIQKMMKGRNWKPGHKYWGLTPEEIKTQWDTNRDSVAGAGTKMHFDIECFMNNSELTYPYTHKDLLNTIDINENEECLEWKYFIKFIKDHPDFKPYRTEWFIYDDNVKLAGSIDMVYENTDGSLMIYDWKRSKEISRINNFNKYAINPLICQMPDSNFWHYALQLNTYKYILENNYDKKVTDLVLVRLHPNNEDETYELISLPDLTQDVEKLFEERKSKL